MNIEPGQTFWEMCRFLFAGPLAKQTSFAGYQHPDGGRCRRGDVIVPQLRRSRFLRGFGAIRDARAQNKRERLTSQFTEKYTQGAAGRRCQPRSQP
ncbi:MAG: hypothetical protein WBE44_07090 [Terriglobales bacterium]